MKRRTRLTRRAVVTMLVLGSAATLAACGGDGASASGDSSTTEAAVPTGVVVPVVTLDNSFRPHALEVHVGDGDVRRVHLRTGVPDPCHRRSDRGTAASRHEE